MELIATTQSKMMKQKKKNVRDETIANEQVTMRDLWFISMVWDAQHRVHRVHFDLIRAQNTWFWHGLLTQVGARQAYAFVSRA